MTRPLPRLTSSSTAKCAQISVSDHEPRRFQQQHAGRFWRAQFDRGTDIIGKGEIGLLHWRYSDGADEGQAEPGWPFAAPP